MGTPLSESTSRVIPALRKATDIVIKFDPRTIVLIPHIETKKDGGVYDFNDGTPRAPQTFSIEPVASTLAGITGTAGGVIPTQGAEIHRWSYYLVGRYDAEMEIGDTWTEGTTTYRITSIQPKNDYEKRAIVTAFGSDPNYGA